MHNSNLYQFYFNEYFDKIKVLTNTGWSQTLKGKWIHPQFPFMKLNIHEAYSTQLEKEQLIKEKEC